jgi:hypothetical protein
LVTGQALVALYDRINLLSQSLMPGRERRLVGLSVVQVAAGAAGSSHARIHRSAPLLVSDAAVLFGVVERVSALPAIATLPVALF